LGISLLLLLFKLNPRYVLQYLLNKIILVFLIENLDEKLKQLNMEQLLHQQQIVLIMWNAFKFILKQLLKFFLKIIKVIELIKLINQLLHFIYKIELIEVYVLLLIKLPKLHLI